MYTVGVFFAWDFLLMLAVTVAYYLVPENIIKKKKEYVRFVLLFLCCFFLLFLVVTNLVRDRELAHMLFCVSFAPLLFLGHLIYPFKEEKRNQHFSFFLFFISLYILVGGGSIVLAHMSSNM